MTPAHHKSDRPIAALLVPDILALLEEAPGDLAAETEEMHPADLANVVEALPPGRVGDLLRALSPNRAAQVIEYLDEELRAEFLEHVTTEQAAEIISEMTPDDRADVLETLEEETADEILSDLPDQAREETEKLLQYEPDTAGGLMTTGFVSVQQSLSIEEDANGSSAARTKTPASSQQTPEQQSMPLPFHPKKSGTVAYLNQRRVPHKENNISAVSNRFSDRTITQACTLLLREAGEPLHVNELYNLLVSGGMEFKGNNPTISVAVSLNRNRRFRKVGPGTFDLMMRDASRAAS